MLPYLHLGSIPPKRHILHKAKPGYKNEGLYYEEVVTVAGFGRAYSICYHLRPPTRVTEIVPLIAGDDGPALRLPVAGGPYTAACLTLTSCAGDPATGPLGLFNGLQTSFMA